jgi:hypothetical protein
VARSGGDLISIVSLRNSCEAREGAIPCCVGNGVSEAVRVAASSVFDEDFVVVGTFSVGGVEPGHGRSEAFVAQR